MPFHDTNLARERLRPGLARHGCATTRQLAAKLDVEHGPRLLTRIGYRGNAPAAWQALTPELEREPDWPGRQDRPHAEE